jgi:CheY-like chemotaxis protein
MAKILIVDDNPSNRSFLVTLLGYYGHSLREASDGAEALDLVLAERPDLVIADILMPIMDGYEFVRRLRAVDDIASTPVIFCTAHFGERDARDLARECGVAQVLTKPGELETMLQAVHACLETSARAPSPLVTENFARKHVRFLTDKLSYHTTGFTAVNLRLEALIDMASQLASQSEMNCLLEEFCKEVRMLIGAKYAVIAVAPEPSERIGHLYTSGIDVETDQLLTYARALHSVVPALMEQRQAVRMRNAGGNPEVLGLPADYPPFESLLVAPIVSPHRSYGWLCLLHKLGTLEFSVEDERLASILSALLGRIYENSEMHAVVR